MDFVLGDVITLYMGLIVDPLMESICLIANGSIRLQVVVGGVL